ncbi:MAG TPA: MgtC/SapB family protein [Ohtaekwangia sp.]|uniref:MgtC/SapB family protein n=1 Tax=Ohtaekwangia sp. TaxID=2066019 RepID=UPI002F9263D0
MNIDLHLSSDYETALQLLLSFVIGTAIGLEREYRSKAAGLRTMIMICLGSTIFTEISMSLTTSSPDRIASNIITGVGFLGAGVIFKDTLTISGITTATTIWIAAALGMAVGAGEYFIAFVGSIAVLIVLTVFENVKQVVIRWHQARTYRITLQPEDSFMEALETELKKHNLRFAQDRYMKDEDNYILIYEVFGSVKNFDALNIFLKNDARVKKYEY